MEPTRAKRILVINPNTSVSITESFRPVISDIDIPGMTFTYWTCPTGPPVIRSQAELIESAQHCIGPIMELVDDYDGLLVAGYGDLPHIPMLKSLVGPKPVVGIFDASVVAALRMVSSDSKFGIITTGTAYEEMLSNGVKRLIEEGGEASKEQLERFGGVTATGIGPQDLSSETRHIAKEKIIAATTQLLRSGDIDVINMGGVILTGMEGWVHEACELALGRERGSSVKVIDQLVAGVLNLDAQFRNDALPNYARALA